MTQHKVLGMRNMIHINPIHIAWMLLLLAAGVSEGSDRYTDALRGFSLEKPEGGVRRAGSGGGELVQWVVPAAADSGEIGAVTVSVLRTVQRDQAVGDLMAYGRQLVEQMSVDQDFRPAEGTPEQTNVASRPALVLAGQLGNVALGRFRREVWILTGVSEFLVVRVQGATDERDRVSRVSQRVVDSVQLFDPAAAIAKLQRDRQRAAQLLSGLDRERIVAALAGRDYWMAILQDGRLAGFMHVQEQAKRWRGQDGVAVISESALAGEEGQADQLTRQEMFTSFDRRMEQWEWFTAEVQDNRVVSRQHMFGAKQNELLVLQRATGARDMTTRTVRLPEEIYLPMALAPVAPRLVGREAGQSYCFAQYNGQTGQVDMRTLTVVGPRQVTLSGRTFDAILLHDQADPAYPPGQLYLGGDGMPLKAVSSDDAGSTVLQQTTGEALKERFPTLWKHLQDMAN